MSLNLSSLKNLAVTPVATELTEVDAPSLPIKTVEAHVPEKDTTGEKVPTEKKPASGPKISLMKLKKDSGINASDAQSDMPEEEMTVGQMEEALLKKQAKALQNNEPPVENVATAEIASTPVPLVQEDLKSTEEVPDSKESESLVIEDSVSSTKQSTPENELKEFFPKFKVMDDLNMDDLIDLGDVVPEKQEGDTPISAIEKPVQIAEEIPTITDTTPEDITPIEETSQAVSGLEIEESIVPVEETVEEAVIAPEEAIVKEETQEVSTQEPIEATTPEATIPLTKEYVAEVKTELSENRRAGFRFFLQKKTKILAGVSFMVLSVSALAMFSSSLLGTDVKHTGKSNVQEVVKNTPPEQAVSTGSLEGTGTVMSSGTLSVASTGTVMPPAPSSIYELGRDYTITKNIKKNIPKTNITTPLPEVKPVTPTKETLKAPVSKKTKKSTKNK